MNRSISDQYTFESIRKSNIDLQLQIKKLLYLIDNQDLSEIKRQLLFLLGLVPNTYIVPDEMALPETNLVKDTDLAYAGVEETYWMRINDSWVQIAGYNDRLAVLEGMFTVSNGILYWSGTAPTIGAAGTPLSAYTS